MRGVQATMLAALEPHLGEKAMRQDSHSRWAKKLADINKRLHAVRSIAGEAYDEMAKRVVASNTEAAKSIIGIEAHAAGVSEHVARVRDRNIALVEDAAREYAVDVREVFDDPANFGLTVKELRDKLLERGSVSDSRAELIARDQTLKLNAGLNRVRQQNAGISSYTWSSSHDERVRKEHAELDGQQFSWTQPPILENGALHPGEDFQCRCVAIPVLDLQDDEE